MQYPVGMQQEFFLSLEVTDEMLHLASEVLSAPCIGGLTLLRSRFKTTT
jgi:hypothetical protein